MKNVFLLFILIVSPFCYGGVAIIELKTLNPNPPSCQVVAYRLKNLAIRDSEFSFYINKIERSQPLSLSELQSLKTISRKSLEDVFDPDDREVQISIRWPFATSFLQFQVQGPGLKWKSLDQLVPDFLQLQIEKAETYLSYTMSLMTFCFSQNNLNLDLYSNEVVNFYAEWEQDLTLKTQKSLKKTSGRLN